MPESMAALTAIETGSLPSGGSAKPPQLSEMMSTFSSTSHSMPRMNCES